MKLGVALPFIDLAVGGDPAAIREFAQTAEEIGYQDLAAPDHVLGVNVASRPDWGDRNTSADLFHDPFVLFGFLAGCILAKAQELNIKISAAVCDAGGRLVAFQRMDNAIWASAYASQGKAVASAADCASQLVELDSAH
jgi:hypothetical protein